jgi:hypothetical protein
MIVTVAMGRKLIVFLLLLGIDEFRSIRVLKKLDLSGILSFSYAPTAVPVNFDESKNLSPVLLARSYLHRAPSRAAGIRAARAIAASILSAWYTDNPPSAWGRRSQEPAQRSVPRQRVRKPLCARWSTISE